MSNICLLRVTERACLGAFECKCLKSHKFSPFLLYSLLGNFSGGKLFSIVEGFLRVSYLVFPPGLFRSCFFSSSSLSESASKAVRYENYRYSKCSYIAYYACSSKSIIKLQVGSFVRSLGDGCMLTLDLQIRDPLAKMFASRALEP